MHHQIYQNILDQLQKHSDFVIGVVDSAGNILACTNSVLVGSAIDIPSDLSHTASRSMICTNGKVYQPCFNQNMQLDYIVFVDGDCNTAHCICISASIAIASQKDCYDEKHDPALFISHVLANSPTLGDMFKQASDFGLLVTSYRFVLYIHQLDFENTDIIRLLRTLLPDFQNDFIIRMTDHDLVIVKQLDSYAGVDVLAHLGQTFKTFIDNNLCIKTLIGVSNLVSHLYELPIAYRNAQDAVNIGHVFHPQQSVFCYDTLGIDKLVSQLPYADCQSFLSYIFKNWSPDLLDSELLFTINQFFENNLNISDTARKLYIHRNTLANRLNKIEKLIGMDLRNFEQSVTFKVALMINKYLTETNTL